MKSLISAFLLAAMSCAPQVSFAASSHPGCQQVREHFVAVGVAFVSGNTPTAETVASLRAELQSTEVSCDFVSVVQMNEMLGDFEAAVEN